MKVNDLNHAIKEVGSRPGCLSPSDPIRRTVHPTV